MSDNNDTRVPNSELLSKQQASLESTQELIRNAMHRVAIDGSKDYNLMSYLQGIAASLSNIGLPPMNTSVVAESDTDPHLLINCNANERIVVFDILLSINAASNISFLDSKGNNALAVMYAPNAGQGYSVNSVRGKFLKRGEPLRVQSSNAINYSVDCSYAIINDEE